MSTESTILIYNRESKQEQDYWIERLSRVREAGNLLLDYERPNTHFAARESVEVNLSSGLAERLNAITGGSDFLLYTTLVAALKIYLHKYTGAATIAVGSPARRKDDGLAQRTNALAIVDDLDDNLTSRELLLNVRKTLLEAYERQNYPFDRLIVDLGSASIENRCPLFDIAIALENIHSPLPDVKNDITVTFIKAGDSISGSVSFNKSLFTRATIEIFADHFVRVLREAVDKPNSKISDILILTEQERDLLLSEWSNNETDSPDLVCAHNRFEEQAEKTPHAVAVAFEDQRFTYSELNERANRLGHYLQKAGVGPESLVAISVERSLDMIVAVLGVLKAGGAFLPLDPAYPKERLAFMLSDSKAKALLTHSRLLEGIPDVGPQAICLDKEWETISQESSQNTTSRATPDNLAYVIYTSGSTGVPKGAALEHRGLANMACALSETYYVDQESRILQFASFSFDASVAEIFSTFRAGGMLGLASQEALMPGQPLLTLLREQRITGVTLPPSVLAVLNEEDLPELQTIISAGESCPAAIVGRWARGRRFINAYGPTEASVCATAGESFDGSRRPPIGRPIPNVEVYILDNRLRPVPVGVPGEIYIGGLGVGRGYLNHPDLTAERFIPHPFSDNPGERLYRSGDLARYLADSAIEYLNRIDNQVKVRGSRIELGEIETVLCRHKGIGEAVVTARELSPGDNRLIAYIVPRSETAEAAIEMKEEAETTGPEAEFWPSVAEYFVYDAVLYYAMTNDERRNNSYKAAFNRLVKDKVVVEVGTGPDAVLARLCIEAGAEKVYAIELLEETSKRAVATVRKLGLQEKIIVIQGDCASVELPEKADLCVSEIVGSIGGSEGAVPILNDARRFLKEGAIMIPQRSITKIAAVSIPGSALSRPCFTDVPRYYAEKIFEQVGDRFDLRVCVRNLSESDLISNSDIFEDLDFTGYIEPEFSREILLTINESRRLDGFLVWLNLHTCEGESIDILEHEHCWLPIYLPVFYPGIEVSKGDVIKAIVTGKPCENGLNPDYRVEGALIRKDGEIIDFEFDSLHHSNSFKGTGFYQALFSGNAGEATAAEASDLSTRGLRGYLSKYLPGYMIPSTFITLESLPLGPTGKLDRRSLPAPDRISHELEGDYVAPRTAVEEQVARIWAEVLNLERVGVFDNYFDLGGHSLLATQLISRLRDLFQVEVPMHLLFESPTVSELSLALIAGEAKPGQIEKIAGILKRMESMSAGDVSEMLQQKRPTLSLESPQEI